MRTHYEPEPRPPQRLAHFEPSAEGDRAQDDRDAYGEFPGQIGDDYDDAERRFGSHRRAGVPEAHDERRDPSYGFRGRGPRGYTRPDQRIYEEICERLTDEDVDVTDVEVRVSNGVATLSGTVRDRRTKREVESIVDAVSGVKDVSNQLRLEGAAEAESKDPLSSLGEERKPEERKPEHEAKRKPEERKPEDEEDDGETRMP